MRLRGYDYNIPGIVFLTICTIDRRCILSRIDIQEENEMPAVLLTEYGKTAEKYMKQICAYYDFLSLESYVIMPNHIHILLRISTEYENSDSIPANTVIARFVSTFKRFCNREYGRNIWQSRSYDHIIRDKSDYEAKIRYIYENPKNWYMDTLYSDE